MLCLVQASQSQLDSMGEYLNSLSGDLSRIGPRLVSAVPNLAVRVGKTQSNISTPRAEQITKSSGYPTPIQYRGLSFGSKSVQSDTTRQNSSLDSPPLNPPIAYPLASLFIISAMHILRRPKSSPPCIIGNNDCAGFVCAAIHLSSHLMLLHMASSTLGPCD